MKKLLTYIMLGMLSIISLASTDIYLPIMSVIAESLQTNVTMIQFSISVFILGLGVGQVIYGYCADHLGLRSTFFAFMCLYIIGSIICGLSHHIYVFLFGRILQAVGVSSALAAWQPLALILYDKEKAKSVVSILFTLIFLSPGFAPALGVYIYKISNWHSCFYVMAVYSIILTGLFFITVPNRKRDISNCHKKNIFSSYYSLLSNLKFINYLFIITCCYSGYLTYLIAFPVLAQAKGRSAMDIGLQFIPLAISFCVGALISKRMMRQYNQHTITFGLAIYTAAVVMLSTIGIFSTYFEFMLLGSFCLLMLGNGVLLPAASFEAITLVKPLAHSASGMLGSSRMLFAFIATSLVSFNGMGGLYFKLMAVLIFTCVISWLCVARK